MVNEEAWIKHCVNFVELLGDIDGGCLIKFHLQDGTIIEPKDKEDECADIEIYEGVFYVYKEHTSYIIPCMEVRYIEVIYSDNDKLIRW